MTMPMTNAKSSSSRTNDMGESFLNDYALDVGRPLDSDFHDLVNVLDPLDWGILFELPKESGSCGWRSCDLALNEVNVTPRLDGNQVEQSVRTGGPHDLIALLPVAGGNLVLKAPT